MTYCLTDHAVMRYRRRIDRTATRAAVQAVIDGGTWHRQAPWGVMDRATEPNDGFIVTREAVFPIVRADDGALVAVTTLCRRRGALCKADRRMVRDQAREDVAWREAC